MMKLIKKIKSFIVIIKGYCRCWYKCTKDYAQRIAQNHSYDLFKDLTPDCNISNGDDYFKALTWALSNKKIKNIALTGPYGSGKSSILETFLKNNPEIKPLRISLATFVKSDKDSEELIELSSPEIEEGILKQLFYKVGYKKIPQSRYRKLHKISLLNSYFSLCGVGICLLLGTFVFSPVKFDYIFQLVIEAGSKVNLSEQISLVMFGLCILCCIFPISLLIKNTLSHFQIKAVKLPDNTEIKSNETESGDVFNKNMDEIIYFFEETDYEVVIFEDLDRLKDSSIFVHLRELNSLLNESEVIRRRIVFIYAVKDDLFTKNDRTKFFDFIIPVIPVINSTNSGEILLELFGRTNEDNPEHNISKKYIMDVSPYISDMRTLLNIYNEFLIYKRILATGKSLKLNDEAMMSLIIFKNQHPIDFSELQNEGGIVKDALTKEKNTFVQNKKKEVDEELEEVNSSLISIQEEHLNKRREVKIAFLSALTNWQGIATSFTVSGATYYAKDILLDSFDFSNINSHYSASVSYIHLSSANRSSLNCNNFSEIYQDYEKRIQLVTLVEDERINELKQRLQDLTFTKYQLSKLSIKELMKKYEVEKIFSKKVTDNKLLVFMLRNGYIDEKYANYINYFKGNSITVDDMNFILSVKNCTSEPFNYMLTKPEEVINRLQIHEFEQTEILNFDLLETLLQQKKPADKLKAYLVQLSNERNLSWEFIDEFADRTNYVDLFINLLAKQWKGMWKYISGHQSMTYERKVFYLSLLINNCENDVLGMQNYDGDLRRFFEDNPDILQKLTSVRTLKTRNAIVALKPIFCRLNIEGIKVEILDEIFENRRFVINYDMIYAAVFFKNPGLCEVLETQVYTTIKELKYQPLTDYVEDNITIFTEQLVLKEENKHEAIDAVVELLQRNIDNTSLCERIIQHEEFCLGNIEDCCKDYIDEQTDTVNAIWDAILKEKKCILNWKNAVTYWEQFDLTATLLLFVKNNIDQLVRTDSECVNDEFIKELIEEDIPVEVLRKLLCTVRMDEFNLAFESLSEETVNVLIETKYFEFNAELYNQLKQIYPNLCKKYILNNPEEFLKLIEDINIDENLFEELIMSRKLDKGTSCKLFAIYGISYMNDIIAKNLNSFDIQVTAELFCAAWDVLEDSKDRQVLMYNNLNVLDLSMFENCFNELGGKYKELAIRNRRHDVKLPHSSENILLAERLETIGYITSFRIKEREYFDITSGERKTTEQIALTVKAVKS